MKVLVTSDFYAEYELYQTNDPAGLRQDIKRLINGEDIDANKHTILGTHDTLDTQAAVEQADEIIYISDFE